MSLNQHWTIAHRTVANGTRILEANSGADVHERICEVLAVHGMARISGGPGSIRSIVRSAACLPGGEGTVIEIALRSQSSVRDLRSQLLESLGLGDEEPRSAAAANVLLLNSLRSRFRVIFVHGAGNAPDVILTGVGGPISAVWVGPTCGTVSPGPTRHSTLDALNRAHRW